ncbi:hypothetical protein PWT90_04888 [Aphanocladium album]|nr:hypothetical protein PWT90_04888 [Aphanocladium album]
MARVNTTPRLAELRKLMKENNISAYIVPSGDSHASEYAAECFNRREYISGFDGSAGTAVISEEAAALSTDGRYFNQATSQLDENWRLIKFGIPEEITWQDWVAEQCKDGKAAGVDPTLITPSVAKKLSETIQKAGGTGLVAITNNLVDKIWGGERPTTPTNKAFVHPEKYAGKSVKDKLVDLREEITKKKAAGMYVTALDEVAWLFNLRGNDVEFNPVFYCYASITQDEAILYVEESKAEQSVREHLTANEVKIKPYTSFFADVEKAPEGKYLITDTASWAVKTAIGSDDKVEEVKSSITDAKSIKNEVELEGMRACHIRDGAALTSYYAWLEHELVEKKSSIDEAQAADKLMEFRKKQDLFVGESFATISCSGPKHGSSSVIDPNAVYLCDAGAQYYDGTTDTTRTMHFGTPTEREKEAYTRVLKGLIALDRAIFPKGATGFALDAFARQFLWNAGLDFRHGTGHGVGSFLNVHEGPMGIGARPAYSEFTLKPGNVLSNEPGYYEDGNFGIRIENVIVVKEVKTKNNFGGTPYYGFENVTMVPYCNNMMDMSLLTQEEKDWINARNKETLEKTQGLVANDELALAFLQRNTQPI